MHDVFATHIHPFRISLTAARLDCCASLLSTARGRDIRYVQKSLVATFDVSEFILQQNNFVVFRKLRQKGKDDAGLSGPKKACKHSNRDSHVEWNKRRVASESELVRGGVMRSVLSVNSQVASKASSSRLMRAKGFHSYLAMVHFFEVSSLAVSSCTMRTLCCGKLLWARAAKFPAADAESRP